MFIPICQQLEILQILARFLMNKKAIFYGILKKGGALDK